MPFHSPLIDQVDAIAALDDKPQVRNLLITQCYHDLGQGFVDLVGTSNVTWCCFAIWASKTAGKFIRGEEIPGRFKQLVVEAPTCKRCVEKINKKAGKIAPHAVIAHDGETFHDVVHNIVEAVTEYITNGNLIVFKELGPLFRDMIHTFKDDTERDDAKFKQFIAPLNPKPSEDGGQSLLIAALTNLYDAKFETDPNKKAETMLLANAHSVLHEQIRLQPSISGSMDAPVEIAIDALLHSKWLESIGDTALGKVMAKLLEPLIRLLVSEITQLWREFSTRELMTMKTPNGVLHLGEDLQPLPGQPLFPPPLDVIENEELKKLLAEYGVGVKKPMKPSLFRRIWRSVMRFLRKFKLVPRTFVHSAADDWSKLPSRMRYIFTLFRSRQQDENLRGQPFTDTQRQVMFDERLPDPPLS